MKNLSACNDFNTSHVSINPLQIIFNKHITKISIHLMFLLIFFAGKKRPPQNYFNTSHVSINPPLQRCARNKHVFQYISCFY